MSEWVSGKDCATTEVLDELEMVVLSYKCSPGEPEWGPSGSPYLSLCVWGKFQSSFQVTGGSLSLHVYKLMF